MIPRQKLSQLRYRFLSKQANRAESVCPSVSSSRGHFFLKLTTSEGTLQTVAYREQFGTKEIYPFARTWSERRRGERQQEKITAASFVLFGDTLVRTSGARSSEHVAGSERSF